MRRGRSENIEKIHIKAFLRFPSPYLLLRTLYYERSGICCQRDEQQHNAKGGVPLHAHSVGHYQKKIFGEFEVRLVQTMAYPVDYENQRKEPNKLKRIENHTTWAYIDSVQN